MKYQPPVGGAANDPYVNRNLGTGTQGSRVPAEAIEDPQREIIAAIAAAGLTPSDTVLTQLLQAILILSRGRTQVFTSNGTFVVPANVTTIRARVWGGGGGGGGCASIAYGASGGGGGGYSEGVFTVTPGASLAVTVGAGGAAGTTAGSNAGTGGTSSVGALLSATGGAGGLGASSATPGGSALAGTGTGGTFNLSGQRGGSAVQIGTNNNLAGAGGAAYGTSISLQPQTSGGLNGNFPGGGAPGSSGNAVAGGVGGAGLAIIDY